MAKYNKITKAISMWPIGSKIIAQFSKYEIMIGQNRRSFLCQVHQNVKFLIYHRPLGKIPILDLIKEKHRLRRLYNNIQDPNIKSTMNRLQKEIRTKINQELAISWEKFCNSISLESDSKKSWHKITNFLNLKGTKLSYT